MERGSQHVQVIGERGEAGAATTRRSRPRRKPQGQKTPKPQHQPGRVAARRGTALGRPLAFTQLRSHLAIPFEKFSMYLTLVG